MANPISNPAGNPLNIVRVGKPIGNINDIKSKMASPSGSSSSETLQNYEKAKKRYEETKTQLESWGKIKDGAYNPVDSGEQKAFSELQKAETALKNAEKAYDQEQEYYNQQLSELKKAGLIKNNQITITNLEQQRKYDLLVAQEKRVNSAADSYNKNLSGYESLVSKYEDYGYIQDNKFNFVDSDDLQNIAALNQTASDVNSLAETYNIQTFGENISNVKLQDTKISQKATDLVRDNNYFETVEFAGSFVNPMAPRQAQTNVITGFLGNIPSIQDNIKNYEEKGQKNKQIFEKNQENIFSSMFELSGFNKPISNTQVNEIDFNPVPVFNFIAGRLTGQSTEDLKKNTLDIYNEPGYQPVTIPGQQLYGEIVKGKLETIQENPEYGLVDLGITLFTPYEIPKLTGVLKTTMAPSAKLLEKMYFKEAAKEAAKKTATFGGSSSVDAAEYAFSSGNILSKMSINNDLMLKTLAGGVAVGLGYETVKRADIQMPELPEFPDMGNFINYGNNEIVITEEQAEIAPERKNSDFTGYMPPDISADIKNINEILPRENYFSADIQPQTVYKGFSEINPAAEFFRSEISGSFSTGYTNPRLMRASEAIINPGNGIGFYKNPSSPAFPQFPDMYDFINLEEEKPKTKIRQRNQQETVIIDNPFPFDIGQSQTRIRKKTKTKPVVSVNDDFMSSIGMMSSAMSGMLNVPFVGTVVSDRARSKSGNLAKSNVSNLADVGAFADVFADAGAIGFAGAQGLSISQAISSVSSVSSYVPQQSSKTRNSNRNRNENDNIFDFDVFQERSRRPRKLRYDRKKSKKKGRKSDKNVNEWDINYNFDPFNLIGFK